MAVLSVIRNTIRYVIDTLHYYFWGLLWPTGIYCASITYEMYGDYNHLLEKAHPYPFGKALYEWSNFIQVPITLAALFATMYGGILFLALFEAVHNHILSHLDARLPKSFVLSGKVIYLLLSLPLGLAAIVIQLLLIITLPIMLINFLYWDVFFELIIGAPRTVFDSGAR